MSLTAADITSLMTRAAELGRDLTVTAAGTVRMVTPGGIDRAPMTGAERVRRHRSQKRNGCVTVQTENVTKCNESNANENDGVFPSTPPLSPPTQAYTHTGVREAPEVEIHPEACTIEQARQMAEMAGIPKEAAEAWWLDHDKRGWIDKQGHRVRNARSSIIAFGRQWLNFEAKQERELAEKRNAVTQRMNGGNGAIQKSDLQPDKWAEQK